MSLEGQWSLYISISWHLQSEDVGGWREVIQGTEVLPLALNL